MPDAYTIDSTIGINYSGATATTKKRWRTLEDEKRVSRYKELEALYLGNHGESNGGPFEHPYGNKAKEENIKYRIFNVLGRAVEVYANIVVGDGVYVTSPDDLAQGLLDLQDFSLPLWTAALRSYVFGFIGLQPVLTDQVAAKVRSELEDREIPEEFWSWTAVDPEHIYINFHPANNKILSIRKAIPFYDVKINERSKISILYEETHYKDRVETRVYEIQGEFIKQELDLKFYTELIDPDTELIETWQHNLGDFLITILFNNLLKKQILSDFTKPAIVAQESLNDSLTQISRILKVHSNPKLLAPDRAAVRDPKTGKYISAIDYTDEVIFASQSDPDGAYRYLTWNGQLTEARQNKEDTISILLTEFAMAPHFIQYPNLTSATSADTASKLEKLSHSTRKKAGRKSKWLYDALASLISNILSLSQIKAGFSIELPDFISPSRIELLDEIITRKQNGLIGSKQAIMRLDDISEEEAQEELTEIHNEANSSTKNSYNNGLFSVVDEARQAYTETETDIEDEETQDAAI